MTSRNPQAARCNLLEIRSATELAHHPLRGAIFESWVASEIFKAITHAGETPDIYFYRDRRGLEVDLIVPRGETTVALEVKSGKTIASDFFSSLERYAAEWQAPGRLDKVLVYGGDEAQRRSDATTVIPWRDLDRIAWVQPDEGSATQDAPDSPRY